MEQTSIGPVAPATAAQAIANLRKQAGLRTDVRPTTVSGKPQRQKPVKAKALIAPGDRPAAIAKPRKTKVVKAGPRIVYIGPKANRQAHDISHYRKVKTATGNTSLDCGDQLARELAGLDLDATYELAARKLGVSAGELRAKYLKLNPGMQRMCLGNRVRAKAARDAAKAE
jgi:hypothetical protein